MGPMVSPVPPGPHPGIPGPHFKNGAKGSLLLLLATGRRGVGVSGRDPGLPPPPGSPRVR